MLYQGKEIVAMCVDDIASHLSSTTKQIRDSVKATGCRNNNGSAQRPSAVMGCNLNEFKERKKRGDVEVILVKEHKTSSGGPARLTMDSRATKVVKAYVNVIRPRIGEGEKLLLLPTAGGGAEPVSRTDTLMSVLEDRYDITIPTQCPWSCITGKNFSDTI